MEMIYYGRYYVTGGLSLTHERMTNKTWPIDFAQMKRIMLVIATNGQCY